MSYFAKSAIRLVPIIFGTGALLGVIVFAINTINLIRGDRYDVLAGRQAVTLILSVGILPMVSYVAFAFYCLHVELLRAILNLRKL